MLSPSQVNTAATFSEQVRSDLLRENNLRRLQYLPSTLPLYKGQRLLLCSKECVRLHLMNGCEVKLEEIVFAEDEEAHMPQYATAGVPTFLRYMPTCLLLRAVSEKWTLPMSLLPSKHEPVCYWSCRDQVASQEATPNQHFSSRRSARQRLFYLFLCAEYTRCTSVCISVCFSFSPSFLCAEYTR